MIGAFLSACRDSMSVPPPGSRVNHWEASSKVRIVIAGGQCWRWRRREHFPAFTLRQWRSLSRLSSWPRRAVAASGRGGAFAPVADICSPIISYIAAVRRSSAYAMADAVTAHCPCPLTKGPLIHHWSGHTPPELLPSWLIRLAEE